MLEIRKAFQSIEEFQQWRMAKDTVPQKRTSDIVLDVRERGLVEPFSLKHYPPGEIAIDVTRLQVSLQAGQLNSRKRAGLLALDFALGALPARQRRQPKILGAEGVTYVAKILRQKFVHYMSTEYIPTPEEKEKFYPIQHLDLTDISMPANIFDLFFSAHVLEHVPDIGQSLKEIYRTLAPGGVLTSTFPFRADRAETVIRAQLKDGRLVHLLEPQYHGNPVNVGEGSLVFQDIGWDILDACAAAGFANPRMAVLASSRYGVVQGGSIGIMALVAQKPIDGDDLPPYPEVFYEGPYF